ncbi:MAG: ATP-grasp domain-containing protein [Candidatus Magnetominusculus sp. LBB02]|nr:ATP-grasp domain-containing protein [Candidatus Magnetominusculus sp. LBB02]
MKIAIIHEQVIKGRPDSDDLLEEIEVVAGALDNLNLQYEAFAVFGTIRQLHELLLRLDEYSPDVIFNLVESHERGQRLFPAVGGLIELAGFAFTGCPYDAVMATTNKIIAKAMMRSAGIPTPDWHIYDGVTPHIKTGRTYIVKPSCEDASVGIEDASVFTDPLKLINSLPQTFALHKQPLLIEEFIEGREINVSIIERGELEVFPIAEIVFENWPLNKPQIVNYNAKWRPATLEYVNTPRQFNPEGVNIKAVRDIALCCWRLFGLRGYGRVDMRIDNSGNIYVIEVNANPCIAHESGYMSAAAEAGHTETDVIRMILEAAQNR